jgi:ribosomal protein S12 methylthiotransferase
MVNKNRISIIPLGCPKNDVDSELIAGAFKKEGYAIEWDKITGETVVINTCGFVKDAIDESLDAIMQSIKAKKEGLIKRVVVTGCLAQRFGEKLSSQLKEVNLFVGVAGFENIPYLLKYPQKRAFIPKTPFTAYPEKLERAAYRSTHSVYLKIADGCSNRCSYCVIPFIKGNLKSRNIQDIIDEARALADRGAVELNLIAQDTMNFGMDRGERELIALLSGLEKIERIKWIRLNYLYPSHITDNFLSFVSESEKIVKYFDVPVQHISDRILKRMNRTTTASDVQQLIKRIKKKIRKPFLRTTVIVGFPGETDEDFNKLLAFFDEYAFHRIGVFPYSQEEPAPASRLKNQVPKEIIIERLNRLNESAQQIMHSLSSDFIDKTYEALIEGTDPDDPSVIMARPWFFAPEIDGYILIYGSTSHAKGQFRKVRITDAVGVDLVGEFAKKV